MACDLTKGRALPCRESVGGIKAVYFVDFGDLGTISLTSDEVTDMTGTFSAYKYELKGASSVEQTINACLLYTSPSPRDGLLSRMPSSA